MNFKKEIAIALMGMVSLASAQEVVTLGTFGFVKNSHADTYHISGMQFNNSPSNTPEIVYGDTLPLGSKIYVWNGSTYDISEYASVFIPPPEGPMTVKLWNSVLELGNGDGYWVEVPNATNATLSGDVPMEDTVTNSISIGLQICSYPYPVDRVVTNLGFTPTLGDKMYVWNGTGYDITEYASIFIPPPEGPMTVEKWNNETLPIAVGGGFWYESSVNVDWIVDRPY